MSFKKKLVILFLYYLFNFILIGNILLSANFDNIKASVRERELENGMKFIVLERHEAPVISFHIYADVGAYREHPGIIGISHLLEHLAFKGTKIVGSKNYTDEAPLLEKLDKLNNKIRHESQKKNPDRNLIKKLKTKFWDMQKKAKELEIPDEFINIMRSQGNPRANASTSWDATQYTDSLPSNKLEFWMSITSDRFLNPVFRGFYEEKEVILEERKLKVENHPIGKLWEKFLATSFEVHPYGQPVLGQSSDLKDITREEVKNYFKKYYSPNNLTIGIVGDVKSEEVFKMAQKYFGRIPGGNKPLPIEKKEPQQKAERSIQIEANSQPILLIGYHRPDSRHKDDIALEALSNILAQGSSSRFHEVLIKKRKVAAVIDGSNSRPGNKFPNLLVFSVLPSRGHTVKECLESVNREIEKIKKESVTPQELTKFKRFTKKVIIDGIKSNARMAAILTHFEIVHGSWKHTFDVLKKVEKLTAKDVKEAANIYLINKNRTVGYTTFKQQ